MDGLRWLLLFFGVLVIAGVYVYSRRERNKPEVEPEPAVRVAPTLGEETVDQELPDPELVPNAALAGFVSTETEPVTLMHQWRKRPDSNLIKAPCSMEQAKFYITAGYD